MIRFNCWIMVSLLILGIAACSSDSSPSSDSGVHSDSGTTTLNCTGNDCKEYVISELLLPADSAQATEFALDFDGDGTKDNALGSILSALVKISPDLALQSALTGAINEGQALVLLKVQGGDFQNASPAAMQTWLGAKTDCCPTDKDPALCAAEAQTTCFSGTHEFSIDPASPTDTVLGGAITGGSGEFGPAKLKLNLPLSSAGSISLALEHAVVKATFVGDKIESGIIAGGITQDDLNREPDGVIPTVAKMLDDTLNDPEVQQTTKDQIKNLFDTDGDDKITVAEVKANPIIQTFLAGDVDVNGDGQLELTLGVGFKAVPAKIKQ